MRKVHIEINLHKPSAQAILKAAQKVVIQNGMTLSKRPDFVIVIGGDGSILHAARAYCKKDIPILGYLFKSTGTSDEMEEVLIFITPHILGEQLMEGLEEAPLEESSSNEASES